MVVDWVWGCGIWIGYGLLGLGVLGCVVNWVGEFRIRIWLVILVTLRY